MVNIVFLGPQGSGKSTQAKLLSQKLKIPKLSTGDFFRETARKKTKDGRLVKKLLEEGKLMSDNLVQHLLMTELKKKKYKDGVIFDGVPRTLNQAKLLERVLDIDKAIHLQIPDSSATKRLVKRGREDDTPELIRKRLGIYHLETDPLVTFYKEKGILEIIDGLQSIESIGKTIEEKIK